MGIVVPCCAEVDLDQLESFARQRAKDFSSKGPLLTCTAGRAATPPPELCSTIDQDSEEAVSMEIEGSEDPSFLAEKVDRSATTTAMGSLKEIDRSAATPSKKKPQYAGPVQQRLVMDASFMKLPDEVNDSTFVQILLAVFLCRGNSALSKQLGSRLQECVREVRQLPISALQEGSPVSDGFYKSVSQHLKEASIVLVENAVNWQGECQLSTELCETPWIAQKWDGLLDYANEYCRQKVCPGIDRQDLVWFAHQLYGAAITRKGEAIAKVDYRADSPTIPRSVTAMKCSERAERGCKRCSACREVQKMLSNQLRYRLQPSYGMRNHWVIGSDVVKAMVRRLNKKIVDLRHQLKLQENPGPASYSFSRVTLPSTEESELVKLVAKAVHNKKISKESFLYRLIYQQFVVLNADSNRGIRWDPDIIAWFQSLKYVGGKRILSLLRGDVGHVQRGRSKYDTNLICLAGPSNTTLKNHQISWGAYDGLPDSFAGMIAMLSMDHQQGLLLFDEIEIRAGLEYSKDTGEVLGLAESAIPICEIDEEVEEDLPRRFAKYIFQVFFVSLDGKLCQPLCFYPTVKATFDWTTTKVNQIIEILSSQGVQIVGTSSDGWSGSVLFSEYLAKLQKWHVDDFVHSVKRMRNSLLEKIHITKDCPSGFSMRTLYTIWCDHKEFLPDTVLTAENIRPTDVMNLRCVLDLFKAIEPLEQIAKKYPENTKLVSECLGLSKYFSMMQLYYTNWLAADVDFETRMKHFRTVVDYFTPTDDELHCLSKESFALLEHTHKSLKELNKLHPFGADKICHLSTNIVENFFSLIRAKERYPSVAGYAITYTSTAKELAKKNMTETYYPAQAKNRNKNYLVDTQVGFTKEMLALLFGDTAAKREQRTRKEQNKGNNEEKIAKAKAIVSRNRPNRRQLLVREFTCKSRADQRHLLACLVADCPKMYRYAKALETHMKMVHNQQSGQSKDALQSCVAMEEEDKIVTEEPWQAFFLEYQSNKLEALHISTGQVYCWQSPNAETPTQGFDAFVSWIARYGKANTLFVTPTPPASGDLFQLFQAPKCSSWYFWSVSELAKLLGAKEAKGGSIYDLESVVCSFLSPTKNLRIASEEVVKYLISTYLVKVQHRDVECCEDYSEWTIKELRAELKARGLKVSGIKSELIERLTTPNYVLASKPDKQNAKKPKTAKKETKAKKKKEPAIRTEPNRLKVFLWDIETSGLSRMSRITEIAAKEASGEGLWSSLIKLPRGDYLSENIQQLTGITEELLKTNGQSFQKAFQTLTKWVEEKVPESHKALFVAHNGAVFDEHVLRNNTTEQPSWEFFDSIKALKVLVGSSCYKLDFLRHHFSITAGGHRAGSDCQALYEILEHALKATSQPYTVEEFLRLCYSTPEVINQKGGC